MQRGYARGLPQGEARGKPLSARGETESQRRRRIAQEQHQQTPDFLFQLGFKNRYGFDYKYWRRLRRLYINEINSRTSPGAQMVPAMIFQVKQAWGFGWRDPANPDIREWEEWVERRLAERLDDMISYQDLGDKEPGHYHWQYVNVVPPIEFWYYH